MPAEPESRFLWSLDSLESFNCDCHLLFPLYNNPLREKSLFKLLSLLENCFVGKFYLDSTVEKTDFIVFLSMISQLLKLWSSAVGVWHISEAACLYTPVSCWSAWVLMCTLERSNNDSSDLVPTNHIIVLG